MGRPNHEMLIAINPFTGAADKDFSRQQILGIIAYFQQLDMKYRLILIGQSDKLQEWEIAGADFVAESTINTAIEIVRHAFLVISPDTSIIHIACGLNTPLLAFYNN